MGEAGTGPRVAREASGVGEAFVNMMEVWDKVFFYYIGFFLLRHACTGAV